MTEIILPIESNLLNEKSHDLFEVFLFEVKISFSKCKYRKILDDIKSRENLFIGYDCSWKLISLKIKAMLKIVARKIYKPDHSFSRAKSIQKWFTLIDNELESMLELIENAETQTTLEIIELILQLYLENIYYSALFSKQERNIYDMLDYLAIGEMVINKFYENFNNSRTFHISSNLLLFLSSIYTSDYDYESAKNSISMCMKLIFHELFFYIDPDEAFDFQKISRKKRYYLERSLNILTLALYNRGAIEENYGNFILAHEAYTHAKWFSLKFLKSTQAEFTQFISDLKIRIESLVKVFFINNTTKVKEEIIEEKNVIIKTDEELENDNEINKFKKQNEARIKSIERMKFPEFENDFKKGEENLKEILYTLKTTNNLLSHDFKDIVKKINNIEIHKIKKENFDLIQKKINDLKSEANYKKMNSTHVERSQFKQRIMSSSKILDFNLKIDDLSQEVIKKPSRYSSKNLSVLLFDECAINPFKSKKIGSLISPKSIKNSINFQTDKALTCFSDEEIYRSPGTKNSKTANKSELKSRDKNTTKSLNYSKFFHSSFRSNEKVQKFLYDDLISNKKHQKKIEALNNICNRELKFQKKLLVLKKMEKDVIPTLELKNADKNYALQLKLKMKKGIKYGLDDDSKNDKKIEDLSKSKNKQFKEKIEMKVVKSLNSKTFEDYNRFKLENSKKKTGIKLRNEFGIKNEVKEIEFEKENTKLLNNILNQIKIIDKKQKDNLKDTSPALYRRIQSKLNAKNNKYQSNKSLENFIRIQRVDTTINYDKEISEKVKAMLNNKNIK